MNLLAHVRRMARYNRWMNDRLYECSSRLSDSERRRDMGAFFKSIYGTLNHLLLTDRLWMGRFTNVPFIAQSLDQELYADFDTLRAERALTDEHIIAWAEGLSEAQLSGTLSYTSLVNPEPRKIPMDLAATHFFNHQTHHRGQVTTLLIQKGIDPGVTDLVALAR